MTNDEAKTLLDEQGAKMVDARVRGYQAETALEQALVDWGAAATELAEALGLDTDVSPDEQYECFVTACELAGVDPEHPALAEERETFRVMQQSGAAGLN
jgi:hypothetical protein